MSKRQLQSGLILSSLTLASLCGGQTCLADPPFSLDKATLPMAVPNLELNLPAQAATHPQKASRVTHSVFETTIKAPKEQVWNALTDFSNYSRTFPRVKSCKVLSKQGDSVNLETVLKPQMFVKNEVQHTLNDMSGKPNLLTWRMLDGNFKSATGEWRLSEGADNHSCKVRYTLEVDGGAYIPKPVLGMVMKVVQKEIVNNVKETVEAEVATNYKQGKQGKISSRLFMSR